MHIRTIHIYIHNKSSKRFAYVCIRECILMTAGNSTKNTEKVLMLNTKFPAINSLKTLDIEYAWKCYQQGRND